MPSKPYYTADVNWEFSHSVQYGIHNIRENLVVRFQLSKIFNSKIYINLKLFICLFGPTKTVDISSGPQYNPDSFSTAQRPHEVSQ